MKALILAAGYATRLYPLTKDKPKPLLKVGGKTIMDYLLERLSMIKEIDCVYVVTNEKFYPHFADWAEKTNKSSIYENFTVKIINDGTKSNETRLGAIADIQYVIDQENIDDSILITAGDNIFQFDFNELSDLFKTKNTDIIGAIRVDDLNRLRKCGVVELNKNGQVVGFEEKPQNPKSHFICPALYIYKRETLSLFKDYLNNGNNPDAPGHFISWLFPRKTVNSYVLKKEYYDIGNLESYNAVCQQFEENI